MIGWLKNPSPVSRFARSTLSHKGRGVASSVPQAMGFPSPLVGEGAPTGRVAREDRLRADEGGFSEHISPIWNDIQRALDGASK